MSATLEIPARSRTGAGEDDFCHLGADDNRVAMCGSTVHHHDGGAETYWEVPTSCPSCGRPTCPACLSIWNTYRASGAWEGA